jgi:hypothetical protein
MNCVRPPGVSFAGLQYYYLEQGGNFAVSSMKSVEDSAVFFRKKSAKKETSNPLISDPNPGIIVFKK